MKKIIFPKDPSTTSNSKNEKDSWKSLKDPPTIGRKRGPNQPRDSTKAKQKAGS